MAIIRIILIILVTITILINATIDSVSYVKRFIVNILLLLFLVYLLGL